MRLLPSRHRSRGAALVTSLIVLGVLMLMGVSAFILSKTQFKLAGNVQFQTLALTDAENAMTEAERWVSLNSSNDGFTTAGTTKGIYPKGAAPDPLKSAWDDANSVAVDTDGNQRYRIELYIDNRVLPTASVANLCSSGYSSPGPCPAVNVYRITTRGASRLGAAKIVQSLYAVRIAIK
jgi:type IV pilus assembly protein PilX